MTPPPDPALVLARARAAGFDDAGIAPVQLPELRESLQDWLESGYEGGMAWLRRDSDVRLDLRNRFPWATSVIVVLRRYRPDVDESKGLGRFVSSYAQGPDYHDVLVDRLRELATQLEAEFGPLQSHAYVDTGPTLERALAERAGLGWIGRNTLLLNEHHGSRFFLGLLITDLPLDPTPDRVASCGECRSCQPACPTGAFVKPGVLDARRCISYLTIEHKGPIDRALRPAMGQWLFGCDLCQTCCPFEMHQDEVGDPALRADGRLGDLGLPDLLACDDDAFRSRFRRTPLWRPRREGLLRNALIVAGNGEHHDCRPAARELLRDESKVLRDAASWCLGRIGEASDEARLESALESEVEPWVREGMLEDRQELLRRLGAS